MNAVERMYDRLLTCAMILPALLFAIGFVAWVLGGAWGIVEQATEVLKPTV